MSVSWSRSWRWLVRRFRAPLVGTSASCWYAGSAEHVRYGALGHAEVHADHSERLTGFVHLLSDCDIVVAEDAIARLHADPSQEAEDGGAVDAELLCERARRFTGSVAIQQL